MKYFLIFFRHWKKKKRLYWSSRIEINHVAKIWCSKTNYKRNMQKTKKSHASQKAKSKQFEKIKLDDNLIPNSNDANSMFNFNCRKMFFRWLIRKKMFEMFLFLFLLLPWIWKKFFANTLGTWNWTCPMCHFLQKKKKNLFFKRLILHWSK